MTKQTNQYMRDMKKMERDTKKRLQLQTPTLQYNTPAQPEQKDNDEQKPN